MHRSTLYIATALFAACAVCVQAQFRSQPVDGLRTKNLRLIAFTNATVVPEPGSRIDSCTVIVQNERIVQVGRNINIPPGADIRDMNGAWMYAGFVDMYMDAGAFAPNKSQAPGGHDDDENPVTPPAPGAVSWNQAVRPERQPIESFSMSKSAASDVAAMGITTAVVASQDGIFRGNGALTLVKSGQTYETIIDNGIYQSMSFDKGSSKTPYPTSEMGSIALIRQTLYDASWYNEARKAAASSPTVALPEVNFSLLALHTALQNKTPFVVASYDEHDLIRWTAISKEFSLPMIYRGTGLEYRRIEHFAKNIGSGATESSYRMILPVTLPKVPNVSDPRYSQDISLQDLMHWYWAADNARLLDSVGVDFCFTADGLKDRSTFLPNIRTMVQRGLDSNKALRALTTIPAEWANQKDRLGRIAPGLYANFVVTNSGLFADGTSIQSVWVAGEEVRPEEKANIDVRGNWTITTTALPRKLSVKIAGTAAQPSATVRADSTTLPSSLSVNDQFLSLKITTDSIGLPGSVRITASADSILMALKVVLPDGRTDVAMMRRDSTMPLAKADTTKAKPASRIAMPHWRPFGPRGADSLVPQNTVVLKNATIWPGTPQGFITNGNVVISGGKIVSVGSDAGPAGAVVYDCTGKFVTAGIIDEHSHIAISRGVNEGSHAVTTEVRIGDVLDPDDINIYRQLAGGVTSSHLLHGSANPMGGQLQFIKLRWGQDAEALRFEGATPTVKFALGENVKQANWGDNYTVRYPQTRMGVEQIMQDAFQAAREYERAQKVQDKSKGPVRKDIQLDALVEILNGKRNIHCHSYVQSEILMLMRLAEQFGFKVHTFTHILEGYKVANEMAKHGAYASTFADWWAYKFEVYDAIPENPAIMHEQGVKVSINSDDAEMARRLNQEASKSVKYGDVSQQDAWNFVTINPATQMEVHDKTGSLVQGKDADVVVWSGNPLSGTSRVERTFVDGRMLFSIDEDMKLRKRDATMRAMLEQEAMKAIEGGETPGKGASPSRRLYHCNDMEQTEDHEHE